MMVKIARLDGVRLEQELESTRDEPREAKRLFEAVCRSIQAEWEKRSRPNAKRDLDWLARTTYDIVRAILNCEQEVVFEARILEHGRRRRGRVGRPNVFQTALMAIFADQPEAVNRRDRERIGKRLWRAYRHYVPSEFLIGFLRQPQGELLPGSDLSRDFESWIIEHRAQGNDDDQRGLYPPCIEDAVDERQHRRSNDYEDWSEDAD